ncbi:PREDICTED: UDP-glycosyltransferase 71K1 [Theobroma cacao]|uniref:Glycosyltransferase n=1 Tax=Theobroma cacao TaxID=3641 RepID=A0AB32WWB2_THECC|nr:PREDICTED: UDP-glycosyltransferase 71K1 [Theobroma cacao]
MKKIELIFIPIPGTGHWASTIEFAKRLIHHDDRIWITILSMTWFSPAFVDAYTKSLDASRPDRIQLIDLPQLDPPSLDLLMSLEGYIYAFIESYIPAARNAVRNIVSLESSSGSGRVAGLVLDFFCAPMIDIATELGLPSYIYYASNAASLGLMLYLPTRHSQNSSGFEITDPEQLIPGFVNPVPLCLLPSPLFNKDGGYTTFIKVAERLKDAKGIMVNTFEGIEPSALNYFLNGPNPPIYPVGPVIDLNALPHPKLDLDQRNKVMTWLDDQPQSSVIFLCFGSMGSFGAPQLKEIALGLEQSGYRFLWSLRFSSPLQSDAALTDKNTEETLPEGFLERIQGRGMICGWAPQVEVLANKAIGGFVSHCGWNSILESLWFGVPIVTWPMHAEQQLNAYLMKELGLAVVMRLDYRLGTSDLVMADEVEKAVRLVMDGGSEVRKKVKEMAEMARKSVMKDGSSFISMGRLIEDMIGSN